MMLLDRLFPRVKAALDARKLCYRNWSRGGEIVLAIYDDADDFAGTVTLDQQGMRPRRTFLTRHELEVIEGLCSAYNAQLEARL